LISLFARFCASGCCGSWYGFPSIPAILPARLLAGLRQPQHVADCEAHKTPAFNYAGFSHARQSVADWLGHLSGLRQGLATL
jgi:hypothetical protein